MANQWAQVSGDADALQQVRQDFDTILRALDGPAVIASLAGTAIDMMQHRTYRGLDVHDSAFEPYSEYWQCVRAHKGLPWGNVTLRFSGTMFDAIATRVESPRSAVVYVQPLTGGGNDTPRDQVAEQHQQGGQYTPKREWFGVSPSDTRRLEREGVALLTEIILRSPRMAPTGNDISVLADRYHSSDVGGAVADYAGIADLPCRSGWGGSAHP